MKNNTFRKIVALVLVWCLTVGGIPTAALSDGMDAAVISTPAPETTAAPAEVPTAAPTEAPTTEPTAEPAPAFVDAPAEPTAELTAEPTAEPPAEPTAEPTVEPTATPEPQMLMMAAPPQIPESVKKVQALIDALPEASALSAVNSDEKLAAYNQTQAAYDAYIALSEEEQAMISGAEKFEALFAVFNSGVATLAATSGDGWYISNGKLHITGRVTALPDGDYSKVEVQGSGELALSGSTNETIANYGKISSGVFYSPTLVNYGSITGGTFERKVDNRNGTITGGTFKVEVINWSTITGGTFTGHVSNSTGGSLNNVKLTGTFEGLSPKSVIHSVNGSDIVLNYNAALPGALGDAGTGKVWCGSDGLPVTGGSVSWKYTSYTAKTQYTVTVGVTANGTVTADLEKTVQGETITLTITPATGYALESVSYTDGTGAQIPVTDNTFTMPESSVTVNAVFKAIDYAVTIDENITNGRVEANKSIANISQTVTLTITPDAGYALKSLTVGGTDVTAQLAGGKYSFAMPASDVAVNASFEAIVYNITVNGSANGRVEANKATAIIGDTVTLTITPDAGYVLKSLTVGGTDVTAQVEDGKYSFAMPASDVTVNASFEAIVYSITVNGSANGKVEANKATAIIGDEVTLTISPEAGYALSSLSVNGNDVTAQVEGGKYSFTMPEGSVTVTATFKMADYSIVISSVTGGTVTSDKATAKMGETVTLTVTVETDYVFSTLRVTDAAENEIPVDMQNYTFTMPASDVRVEAGFTALLKVTAPGGGELSEGSDVYPDDVLTAHYPVEDGITYEWYVNGIIYGRGTEFKVPTNYPDCQLAVYVISAGTRIAGMTYTISPDPTRFEVLRNGTPITDGATIADGDVLTFKAYTDGGKEYNGGLDITWKDNSTGKTLAEGQRTYKVVAGDLSNRYLDLYVYNSVRFLFDAKFELETTAEDSMSFEVLRDGTPITSGATIADGDVLTLKVYTAGGGDYTGALNIDWQDRGTGNILAENVYSYTVKADDLSNGYLRLRVYDYVMRFDVQFELDRTAEDPTRFEVLRDGTPITSGATIEDGDVLTLKVYTADDSEYTGALNIIWQDGYIGEILAKNVYSYTVKADDLPGGYLRLQVYDSVMRLNVQFELESTEDPEPEEPTEDPTRFEVLRDDSPITSGATIADGDVLTLKAYTADDSEYTGALDIDWFDNETGEYVADDVYSYTVKADDLPSGDLCLYVYGFGRFLFGTTFRLEGTSGPNPEDPTRFEVLINGSPITPGEYVADGDVLTLKAYTDDGEEYTGALDISWYDDRPGSLAEGVYSYTVDADDLSGEYLYLSVFGSAGSLFNTAFNVASTEDPNPGDLMSFEVLRNGSPIEDRAIIVDGDVLTLGVYTADGSEYTGELKIYWSYENTLVEGQRTYKVVADDLPSGELGLFVYDSTEACIFDARFVLARAKDPARCEVFRNGNPITFGETITDGDVLTLKAYTADGSEYTGALDIEWRDAEIGSIAESMYSYTVDADDLPSRYLVLRAFSSTGGSLFDRTFIVKSATDPASCEVFRNGSLITDGATIAEGDVLTLKVYTAGGSDYTGELGIIWQDGGIGELLAENVYGYTVDADKVTSGMLDLYVYDSMGGLFDARFFLESTTEEATRYTILIRGKGGQGTVVPDKAKAAEGETVTLIVTPETGWYLSSVKVYLGYPSTEIAVTDNSFIMPAGDVIVDAAFLKYRQIRLTKADEYDISISSSSDGSYGSSLDTTPYGEVYVKVEPANDAVVIDSVYFEENESVSFIQLSGQQIWYVRVPLNAPETLTVKVKCSYLAPTFTVTNQDGDELHEGDTIHPNDKLTVKYVSGTGKSPDCKWFLDDDSIGNTTECSFDIVSHPASGTVKITVRNLYEKETTLTLNYVVFTVTIDGNITGGTVTADPTTAAEGDSINLRAISNAGYKLTSLMIDGEYVTLSADDYYGTFSMPDHDVIITATFEAVTYNVSYARIGGYGSVSGLDAAKTGDMVELNVSPAEGYLLQSIDVYNYSTHNSFEVKPDANGKYSFTMPAGNVQVQYGFRKAYTVTLAGSDHGTVTFADGYASPFMAGSTVCLTIAPEEGYVLDTVTVKGDNGGTYTFDYNNKSFQMPEENVTVTVKFKPEAPVFTVTNQDGIELHEGDTFHPNDKLTVTYISGTGTSTDCEWFLDDVSIRTGTECSFYSGTYPTSGTVKITARNNLGGETTLTLKYVVFAVKIDKNITGGTVTASRTTAAEGETVGLTATPNDGYQFVSMTVDGVIVDADATGYYRFTMSAKDVTVTATFEARTYMVEYAREGGLLEYGSVSGQNSAKMGDTVELTVSPAEGYRLQKIEVYNYRTEKTFLVEPDANGKYSFTMPGDHVQVLYRFDKAYTVTLADSNYGTVTFAKGYTSPFMAGSTVCLTITPEAGYVLDTVTVKGDNGGTYTFDSATNSFQMPTENVTVTATFKVKVTIEPVLTVTRNGAQITDTSNIYEGDELKASFTGVEGEVTYWWYVEKEGEVVTLSETDSYTVSAADMEGAEMLILSVDYPGGWDSWNLFYSDEAPQPTPTVTRNGVELSEGEYVSPGDVLIASHPGAAGFMWTCDGKLVSSDATCIVPQGLEEGSWLYLEAYDGDGLLEPISFQYKVRYNVTIARPEHGTVTAEKYAGYEGDVIRLSLTPEQGYVLSSLTVDGQSIIVYEETSKHEFRMPDHNVIVTATFEPMTYGIAYMQAGSPLTWGTVTGPDGAKEGEKVKLTVSPADGYQLERLYVDIDSGEHDVKEDENGEYSFIMPAEFVHIRFAFAAIYTVTIDEAIMGGKVTADKTAAFQGETVTLTVEADEGYHLVDLSVKNAYDNSYPTFEMVDPDTDEFIGYGFEMPYHDVTVRAVFSRDEDEGYAVIVAPTTGGTVEVNKTTAPEDEIIIFTAEPDAGYELDAISVTNEAGNEISVTENTNPTTGESDYRFTMPAGNVTITVTFTKAYSIENGWLYVYTRLTELPSGNYTAICVLQDGELVHITTDLPVENYGTITYGIYSGTVTNYGTVTSGTFRGEVNNYDKGTLTDSTFNGDVYNYAMINSGSFYDDVYNTGNISSSIFYGIANNHSGGNITNSYFYGDAYNYSGGLIDDGILYEDLVNYVGAEIRNSTIKLDATVISNEGTLTNCKKEHTVEYQTKALTYGANLLSELGDPGTGRIWCVDGVEVAPDATVPLEASKYEHLYGYNVNIDATENGSITADTYFTISDKTITLTVMPDTGYELDSISIAPNVTPTQLEDGRYTFQMPMSDVTVTATFKAIEPSYIIIIPAGLNLNETQTLTISVDEVENLNGKEIVVKVDSDGTLECGGSEIAYSLSTSSFSFTQNGSFDLALTVGDTTGKPAGEYEDVLTFTATVQEQAEEE